MAAAVRPERPEVPEVPEEEQAGLREVMAGEAPVEEEEQLRVVPLSALAERVVHQDRLIPAVMGMRGFPVMVTAAAAAAALDALVAAAVVLEMSTTFLVVVVAADQAWSPAPIPRKSQG